LVPQREVFEDQGAVGPDPAEEADEDEGDHAGHHRSGRSKVNVDKVDGVSRRHRIPDVVLRDCRARAETLTAKPVSRVGAAIVVGVWLLLAGLAVWLIRTYLAT
jgi:hypothetical protein